LIDPDLFTIISSSKSLGSPTAKIAFEKLFGTMQENLKKSAAERPYLRVFGKQVISECGRASLGDQ
jgi:hypothetical protein